MNAVLIYDSYSQVQYLHFATFLKDLLTVLVLWLYTAFC